VQERREHEQRRDRDQQGQQDEVLVRAEGHGATIRIACISTKPRGGRTTGC
jgi:hypothetical protein